MGNYVDRDDSYSERRCHQAESVFQFSRFRADEAWKEGERLYLEQQRLVGTEIPQCTQKPYRDVIQNPEVVFDDTGYQTMTKSKYQLA